MIEKITSENFNEKVLQATGRVLVDFSAVWCGPCQALAPVLEQVSAEHAASVQIYSLDIDENRELAQQFKITAVPAMLLFEGGKNTGTLVGLQTKDAIEKFLGFCS